MKFKNDEDKLNYLRSEQYLERANRILSDKEYAAAPDDDPTNPWKSGAQYFEGQISNEDAIGLQLISLSNGGIFNEQNPPSQQQKLLVQNFLERSIGNGELNKFLNQDSVKQTDYYSSLTKSTAVNQLAYFSYKTRKIKEMGSALEKLDSLHNAIQEGYDVREQDKITLREFATVSELSKTLPFLENLNKSGFIEGNENLTAMYNQAKKAKDIVSTMEEQMTSDLKKAGPGVVIVDSTTKKSKILGKMLGLFEKIAKLFSKHGHASMLHFSKDGQVQRSHVNPQLVQDKFDITKQLYGDMHKIDPVKLIPEDRHIMLKQVYGKEWKQVVAAKFKNIESELHNNARTKFGPIGASSEKQQYLAGLANIVPFGHKKLSANDYKDLHEKIMSGEFAKNRGTDMLCSEFVATTIAVSVVELDKQIKEDMRKHKGLKLAGVDLDKDVVQVPFGKHENLHRMHPDRLVSELKKRGCVESVVTTSTKYFKTKSVKAAKAIGSKLRQSMANSKTSTSMRTRANTRKSPPMTR